MPRSPRSLFSNLPSRVEIGSDGGGGRAALAHAEVGLVLVATVMQFELCYVKEWVEYHLHHGGPTTTLYLLPQRGPPYVSVHDPGQARFHPRVHVLCNVSGRAGSCESRAAAPYGNRYSHQMLMLHELVPRREFTRAS